MGRRKQSTAEQTGWRRSPLAGILFLMVCGLSGRPMHQAIAACNFYEVPSTLASYKVGNIIKAEPVLHLSAALDGTRATRIMYRSSNQQGQASAVTGMVFVPAAGEPPEGGWPVLSFTHGTTGVGNACAPSRYPNLYWDVYARFVGRLVRHGFVVVATDYQGLGTPGLHPWLELDSEARAAIDAVAAARLMVPETRPAWAVVGHSQGGHAALGVAELAARWQAPGLTFVGAVSLAPGSHLIDLAPLVDSPAFGWDLLAYVAASIRASAPDFDYAEMLVPPLLTDMPRARQTCDIELFQYFSTTYDSSLVGLRPGWQESAAVAAWFARNEPGQRPATAPVLLIQGALDPIVPTWATTDLAARLCGHGNTVAYHVLPGADHDAVLPQGYHTVVTWLRDRFAGVSAPSTCP